MCACVWTLNKCLLHGVGVVFCSEYKVPWVAHPACAKFETVTGEVRSSSAVPVDIQLIVARPDQVIKSCITAFDLDVVQNWFDGGALFTTADSVKAIVSRQTVVSANVGMLSFLLCLLFELFV